MLNLPRKKNGKPYISFSQRKSWTSPTGYIHSNILGRYEYIRSYFFGEYNDDPYGYSQFGLRIEKAIDEQNFKGFTKRETNLLKKVDTLDLSQVEVFVDMGEYYVNGYIDFATKDLSFLKDLKTKSENSKKDIYRPDNYQLPIYAIGAKQMTGKYPTKLQYDILERLGNGHRGEELKLGTNLWFHERKMSLAEYEEVVEAFNETAKEISEYYTFFQKYNQ